MEEERTKKHMTKVCIIGAGPAGLVASKTFLRTGGFEVTVYEKHDRIGGIWRVHKDDDESVHNKTDNSDEHWSGFLSPLTPVNLSRFNVGFSDLDWNAIDDIQPRIEPQEPTAGAETKRDPPPIFPLAWQVNKYLETYRQKYIPEGIIRLQHEVVKVERCPDGGDSSSASPLLWEVTTKDQVKAKTTVARFDVLIVAAGFFSTPRTLSQNVPNLPTSLPIQVAHSSQVRDIRRLVPGLKSGDSDGESILVIGGGNSSGETSAALAMQLSDLQWSPHTQSYADVDKSQAQPQVSRGRSCKIIHVSPRPMLHVPPYLEYEPGSLSYLPIDLKFYDLSKKPPGPIVGSAGAQSSEVSTLVRGFIQDALGTDQSDLGSDALVSTRMGADGAAPYAALSNSYPEFARSGAIDVVGGRVVRIEADPHGAPTASAVVRDSAGLEHRIDNIAAVVYATGYSPSSALSFLPADVKQALDHDDTSMRLPLILSDWQTSSAAIPSLAFLGWFEGPNWGTIEMQARMLANRFSSQGEGPTSTAQEQSLVSFFDESPAAILKIRARMASGDTEIPQYWFADYAARMEEYARMLGLERNDSPFASAREGIPSPARYLAATTDQEEASKIMRDLHDVWYAGVKDGRFVARAIMHALQGHWNIQRQIDSRHTAMPGGKLEGTARFEPRFPTPDRSGRRFDLEYLYIEDGIFSPASTASTVQMRASRRYVYRYAEAKDELSVWFVKPDRDREVDYLFHGLDFISPAQAREAGACIAKADHLCVKDMYETEYRFKMKGVTLTRFETRHVVRGPRKDYTAVTVYTRPDIHEKRG